MSQKTFREIYIAEGNKPTPRQVFLSEVAELTKKSEATVRQWLSGNQSPDALTQEVLAKHFNTTPQELFPTA